MTSQIVASVIILGNVQPYKRKKTRQELFSEIVLMYVMYTMICFTPFVPDVQVKFFFGYITIAVISLHLMVSLY